MITDQSSPVPVCLISAKNLYRISRVPRQAQALRDAGYDVTVYCLGLPHEALMGKVKGVRFVKVDSPKFRWPGETEIREMRQTTGLEVLPYMPNWLLSTLFRAREILRLVQAGTGRARPRRRAKVQDAFEADNSGEAGQDTKKTASIPRRSELAATLMALPGRAQRRLEIRRLKGVAHKGKSRRQAEFALKQLSNIAPQDFLRFYIHLGQRASAHTRFGAAVWRRISDEMGAGIPPPKIVQGHDTHSIFAATYIAQKLRVPFIYDAVEIPEHQILAAHRPQWSDAADSILRRLERPLIERADRVITVGENLAGWYKENYQLIEPPRPIRNTQTFQPAHKDERIRCDCGIGPDVPLLFWCGSASPHRGLETAVELLPYLPDYHLALVTEFPAYWEAFRCELLARIDKGGVENRVHILAMRDPGDLIGYASGADIALIASPKASPLNVRYSLPNKFFEMVMARLPIAATNLDNVQLLIRRYGNGVRIDEHDLQSAAKKLRELFEKQKTPAFTRRLERAAKALCWERESAVFAEGYQELLQAPMRK